MRQSVSKSNCSSILCNSIPHKTLCTPTSAPVPNYATCWQSKANSPTDRYLRTVFFSLRQSYLQHSMSQHPPLSEALSSIKPRFTSGSEIEITERLSQANRKPAFLTTLPGTSLAWRSYYQPRSHESCHTLNINIQATVLLPFT